MAFALGLWDISLLLAVIAIVLLLTSELLSPYYGRTNLTISKRKLRNAAITMSLLFLATVAMRVVAIIFNL